MAKRAKIVSFEDAKKSRRSSSARSASRSDVRASRRLSARETVREARESREAREVRESREVDFENSRDTARATARATARKASRESRRRERNKAKADRLFSKQFTATSSSDASAEGAPRAALYETKMGAKHRKSARMQRSSSASSPAAKINPAGWFSSLPITARSLKVGTAVLCLVLVCVFLYTPAQKYYQAQREYDRLSAEYGAIEERNEALDVQNDILASDAGMEDAVRQKYGYVKTGEQVAVVTGLSDEATDASRDGENIEANVLSSTVRAPEEWYTPLLDTFFGVE